MGENAPPFCYPNYMKGCEKDVRFLKRILISVLVYMAIYLPFVVVMQSVSGADLTAAYAAGCAPAIAELILCTIIKREEARAEKEMKKNDRHNINN